MGGMFFVQRASLVPGGRGGFGPAWRASFAQPIRGKKSPPAGLYCITMNVEPLESRRLLASTLPPTFVPSSRFVIQQDGAVNFQHNPIMLEPAGDESIHLTRRGTLVIHGTTGDDYLHVRQIQDDFTIERRPGKGPTVVTKFNFENVKRILIEGAAGDDYLQVSLVDDRPVTLTGQNGNDVLIAGRGDTLVGGDGDDKLVAAIQGKLPELKEGEELPVPGRASLLQGGAGRDRLYATPIDLVHGGGGGGDRAVVTVTVVDDALPPLGDEPGPYAQQRFGERAVGIESFATERTLVKVTIDSQGRTQYSFEPPVAG